ncbi:MAG TPA: cell envelope integrity protein TolA [Rudaea sp.]|jgi:colicin import membrane protein|nr:cell envelope integrity protein TolA [Rudaea sp.]
MESFRDKARAFGLALLVHAGVAAVLLLGLLWTQSEVKPISLPGPVIEAELVGITGAPQPRASSRPKPTPPKPAPEPPKPPEPAPQPPSQPQRNDAIEREKIAEMAQEKAEQAQRAQEERHKQEQVLLEEQQRKERDRLAELEKVKRQREELEKKLKLEKEKLAQLNDLQKQPPKPVKPTPQPVPPAEEARTGNNGQDSSLEAQYFAAIQNAITNNWLRPDTTPAGLHCMIDITQIPGGDLLGAHVVEPCNADPLTRNSIEQAVRRAAPLPYKGYENVFRREIKFNFHYDG